jgi:hypothetical protein
MKRHLTEIDEPMTILSAGKTDAGSAKNLLPKARLGANRERRLSIPRRTSTRMAMSVEKL